MLTSASFSIYCLNLPSRIKQTPIWLNDFNESLCLTLTLSTKFSRTKTITRPLFQRKTLFQDEKSKERKKSKFLVPDLCASKALKWLKAHLRNLQRYFVCIWLSHYSFDPVCDGPQLYLTLLRILCTLTLEVPSTLLSDKQTTVSRG